jgi:hypothetical protein
LKVGFFTAMWPATENSCPPLIYSIILLVVTFVATFKVGSKRLVGQI